MSTFPPYPEGAIESAEAFNALPRSTLVYLVTIREDQVGLDREMRDAFANDDLRLWNVGERSLNWKHDFVFTNYWFAYAYCKRMEARKWNTTHPHRGQSLT